MVDCLESISIALSQQYTASSYLESCPRSIPLPAPDVHQSRS